MSGLDDPIAQPLSAAADSYEVVVVGSGYGGGIAASRLARAGRQVAVLERGREIRPGKYPSTAAAVAADTQITTGHDGRTIGRPDALYDFRLDGDMNVVVGCGLGGTSLINANVALEVDKRLFAGARWPKVFVERPDLLDPYYERARQMLGSTPYPDDQPSLRKLTALEKSATALRAPFARPPINVTFKDGPNAVGVEQKACTLCGDCCSGCNHGAKNTVLMNYLPDAKAHGAALFTGASVLWLEQQGSGWIVAVAETGSGERDVAARRIAATVVVLAAGTLGSTEILLRSKAAGLPVSAALGKRFSGNGDVLAFGYNAHLPEPRTDQDPSQPSDGTGTCADRQDAPPEEVAPPPIYGIGAGGNKPESAPYKPGPCIAGLIDMRDPDRPLTDGLVIEEGVMPGALAMAYVPLFFMADALGGSVFRFADAPRRLADAQAIGKLFDSVDPEKLAAAAYDGPLARTQTFLVMSHDDAGGEIRLNGNRAVVHWPDAGRSAKIARDNAILAEASDAIRAEFLSNPLWGEAFGRKLVSVHPVGGCAMADDAAHGVVNDRCQVFAGDSGDAVHDGLYVCDGSVLPGALGVNPLLTISAVSERAVEKLAAERGWTRSEKPVRAPKLVRLAALPSGILDKAIEQLAEISEDIDAARFQAAMSKINTMILLANLTFKLSLPTAEQIVSDIGNDTVGGKTYARDEVLGRAIGPVLAELLPVLQEIKTALDHGADEAKVFAIVKDKMGDFSPGLVFVESMSGALSDRGLDCEHPVADPYAVAAGSRDPAHAAVARFHVEADSIDKLMPPTSDPAPISGTLECPALGGDFSFSGLFRLLPQDAERVETWTMFYGGWLAAHRSDPAGGTRKLFMRGTKTLRRRLGSNWWADLTTLAIDIHGGEDEASPVIARGLLRLDLQDLAAQAATLRAVPADSLLGPARTIKDWMVLALRNNNPSYLTSPELRGGIVKLGLVLAAEASFREYQQMVDQASLASLMAVVAKLVFRTYGGPLAYLSNFPAVDNAARHACWQRDGPPRRQHPAPAPDPANPPSARQPVGDRHYAVTRYQGGDKGPVILAPGFGFTAASFALPTVAVNLVEYLAANGYDVWLLDYRGSPALLRSRDSFTIDDIATQDWPDAVAEVRRRTGASDVQCIAHCVGSMTLLMAVLNGMPGVRSIISSQLTLHPVTSWFNNAKADSRLASLLLHGVPPPLAGVVDALDLDPELAKLLKKGMRTVNFRSATNPDDNSYMLDKAIDAMLWGVPFAAETPCYSPACHRVFGIFGPSYAHDRLNQATHDALLDFLGEIAVEPFLRMAEIARAGYVTGDYLAHPERLGMPIDFVAGARNQIFYPETSLRTVEWLREANPEAWRQGRYTRKVLQDYAHMDLFIGRAAATDIFPYLLERLESRG